MSLAKATRQLVGEDGWMSSAIGGSCSCAIRGHKLPPPPHQPSSQGFCRARPAPSRFSDASLTSSPAGSPGPAVLPERPSASRRHSNHGPAAGVELPPAGRALPRIRRASHDATRRTVRCLVALSAMTDSIPSASSCDGPPSAERHDAAIVASSIVKLSSSSRSRRSHRTANRDRRSGSFSATSRARTRLIAPDRVARDS